MKEKTMTIAPISVRSEGIDGKDLPEDEFLFDAEVSNGDLDTYFSRMSDSTLKNYFEDAEKGIPFLDSHKRGDLSTQIGRSVRAKMDRGRLIVTFSMLRDTEETPTEMRVNEIIRRIERGYYDSTSVGFRGGEEICDLCDKNIWDYRSDDPCIHVPGEKYDGKVCTYEIRDARLDEVSLVTTPANPNAKVLDTREWSDDLKRIKEVIEKNDDLSILEQDGQKYRNELIDDAIKFGIRAIDDFNEELWRKRFTEMDADYIKEQSKSWLDMGNLRWGDGGRSTKDNHQDRNRVSLPNYVFE